MFEEEWDQCQVDRFWGIGEWEWDQCQLDRFWGLGEWECDQWQVDRFWGIVASIHAPWLLACLFVCLYVGVLSGIQQQQQ